MPLVRVSLRKGKPAEFRRKLSAVIYETMVETINVPARDNFQIITEHDPDGLIYDPEYLDVRRTDDVIFIQITLNEGRTVELKKALYKRLAERLHHEMNMRMEDIFIGLIEVKKENWSFGNGEAQYAR